MTTTNTALPTLLPLAAKAVDTLVKSGATISVQRDGSRWEVAYSFPGCVGFGALHVGTTGRLVRAIIQEDRGGIVTRRYEGSRKALVAVRAAAFYGRDPLAPKGAVA